MIDRVDRTGRRFTAGLRSLFHLLHFLFWATLSLFDRFLTFCERFLVRASSLSKLRERGSVPLFYLLRFLTFPLVFPASLLDGQTCAVTCVLACVCPLMGCEQTLRFGCFFTRRL